MTKTKNCALKNIFAVLIGALLMGFLWRIRGESGWGSSWGLLNAGFVFTMFIMLAKSERSKMDIGWLALTSLSFMLTVPAWGTLLTQITGVLHKPSADSIMTETVYVSVPSAITLMLCLGFGLATLFGIMLGRGFSDKQWKIKDFIIVLAVFFITDLISKASLAHWILDLIQPQAAELFENGLAAADMEADAFKAYLQHFDNISWGKKIEGGRNYFSAVETIASAIRAVFSIIAVRFVVKDKISARTGLFVSAAFAFAITISDLFFYFGSGGYHMESASAFTSFIYPWSCWEYFTGFFAGGLITAYILKLKETANLPEITFSKVPEKANSILTFILGFAFLIGVNIVRPVLVRYEDSPYIIVAVIIAVIAAVAAIILINVKFGLNAKKISTTKLFSILLPCFVAYIIFVYMFIGIAEKRNIGDLNSLHTILCIISSIAVIAWSLINTKKIKE